MTGTPYGPESVMCKIHLAALKSDDAPRFKSSGKVNVGGYCRNWNLTCPKGEELSDTDRRTLTEWLNGRRGGGNFEYSQTKGAKRTRRYRNRKEEGKKVVETTDAFVFE